MRGCRRLIAGARSSAAFLFKMPVVQEVRRPRSLDFANERKAVLLRTVHGCTWAEVQRQVRNLKGEAPSESLRRLYKYNKCGRKATKATKAVQAFLVKRLVSLRLQCACTAMTLQRELVKLKGINLDVSTIRKVLSKHGYQWLPKAQKRKYSPARKRERVRFAQAVRLSAAQLREKLALSMDGVILSIPPRDATDRANYCAHGDSHMWRRRGEAGLEKLAGQDPYPQQVAQHRLVPFWGGLSQGGFSIITFHKARKLTTAAWCRMVADGKLTRAIQALAPVRPRGPWKILCDNESFLHTAASKHAMAAEGITAWRVPAGSPDLNPVEKMWAWLRKRLHALDRENLRRRRPPIGVTALKARIRSVLASHRAQVVAGRIAAGFRTTCKEVLAKKGGMARS